jgi:hypothetical protein
MLPSALSPSRINACPTSSGRKRRCLPPRAISSKRSEGPTPAAAPPPGSPAGPQRQSTSRYPPGATANGSEAMISVRPAGDDGEWRASQRHARCRPEVHAPDHNGPAGDIRVNAPDDWHQDVRTDRRRAQDHGPSSGERLQSRWFRLIHVRAAKTMSRTCRIISFCGVSSNLRL